MLTTRFVSSLSVREMSVPVPSRPSSSRISVMSPFEQRTLALGKRLRRYLQRSGSFSRILTSLPSESSLSVRYSPVRSHPTMQTFLAESLTTPRVSMTSSRFSSAAETVRISPSSITKRPSGIISFSPRITVFMSMFLQMLVLMSARLLPASEESLNTLKSIRVTVSLKMPSSFTKPGSPRFLCISSARSSPGRTI